MLVPSVSRYALWLNAWHYYIEIRASDPLPLEGFQRTLRNNPAMGSRDCESRELRSLRQKISRIFFHGLDCATASTGHGKFGRRAGWKTSIS